jgi:hypothetical protein
MDEGIDLGIAVGTVQKDAGEIGLERRRGGLAGLAQDLLEQPRHDRNVGFVQGPRRVRLMLYHPPIRSGRPIRATLRKPCATAGVILEPGD